MKIENNFAWAIVYTTYSRSPRSRRWYHVARVAFDGGVWFELYWAPDINFRNNNLAALRKYAKARLVGGNILPGVYTSRSTEGITHLERT